VSEASNGGGVNLTCAGSEASNGWLRSRLLVAERMQARGAQHAWRGGDPLGMQGRAAQHA
jgi:hypothetical protein